MQYKRLMRIEATSQDQLKTQHDLLDGEGLCTCGRVLKRLSPKFILANFIIQHPDNPDLGECVVMAAYCYDCFQTINKVLKSLRNNAVNRDGIERGH